MNWLMNFRLASLAVVIYMNNALSILTRSLIIMSPTIILIEASFPSEKLFCLLYLSPYTRRQSLYSLLYHYLIVLVVIH